MSNVNIGKELHLAAKDHLNKSITQIAQEAGYSQSTFYKHKIQSDLSFDILYKYAKVMDYYFANEIPEFTEYLKSRGKIKEGIQKSSYEELEIELKESDKQKFQLSQRVIELQSRNNDLLQENFDKTKRIEELERQIALLLNKKNT